MKKVEIVTKLAQQLIKHLEAKVEVKVEEDKEGVIMLQLETEEPGRLIGYHGETLAAFQLILALMAYQKTGEWTRVSVNIGDYRQRREESLTRLATSAAQKVKFSGQPQVLPPMSSAERRLIHLALAEDDEVATASEGEEGERRVIIKPKQS